MSQPWSHLSHQSILPNLKYREPIASLDDKNIAFHCSLQSEHGAYLGGTSLVVVGQRLNHRESRDMESEITIPLYQLNINASQGCQLKYVYRTLLMDDVKVILSCHFSLNASNAADTNEFFKSWSPPSYLIDAADDEDGFRATVTTTNDASESRCFLFPATEETTDENDWITKIIDIPSVSNGNQLFIKRIEVSVIVNTASFVGLTPHVIACLGYLSIIPTTTTNTQALQIQNLQWSDKHLKKVQPLTNNEKKEDLSDIATQEETYQFFGTLSWKNESGIQSGWKEVDYFTVSHEIDGDINTRTFLGTAFCEQYRVSGLNCVNKSRAHRIVVEAVNKEGYISALASLDIAIA